MLESPEGKLYLLTALVKDEAAFGELESFVKKSELTIKKSENLGRRVLAYPINKQRELTLASIFFTAEANIIPELEKSLHHEESIERFLLTTWKGDLDAPKRYNKERPTRVGARSEGDTNV